MAGGSNRTGRGPARRTGWLVVGWDLGPARGTRWLAVAAGWDPGLARGTGWLVAAAGQDSEGYWVAGSGAGPVAGKGNRVAGRGSGAGLGSGKWAEDGPDCRLGLGTLPAHDSVRGPLVLQ